MGQTRAQIEYVESPPALQKAMEWQWAQKLIRYGQTRLTHVSVYREPTENPDQCDPYEDIGIEDHSGMVCTVRSVSEPFVWCASNCTAASSRILRIDSHYDVLLLIHDPTELFNRFAEALLKVSPLLCFQAGAVAYDKRFPASDYYWGKNTFQKDQRYAYQREYRFAVHEPGRRSECPPPVFVGQKHIPIQVGSCYDIITLLKPIQ